MKYAFASSVYIEPGQRSAVTDRVSVDLQKMIIDRLGCPPVTPASEAAAFQDPSLLVVSVNHVPLTVDQTEDAEKRWLGIALRNSAGSEDSMLKRAEVVLDPEFNPLPHDVRNMAQPGATIFPIRALPSRCSPEAIAKAASRYWKKDLIKISRRPMTAILIGNLRSPELGAHLSAEELGVIARHTIKQIRATIKKRKGSVLLVTSRRTHQNDERELLKALRPWLVDSATSLTCAANNAYYAFLGLADEVMVYGDSLPMVSDVLATQKPFRIIRSGESFVQRKRRSKLNPIAAFSTMTRLHRKYLKAANIMTDTYMEILNMPPLGGEMPQRHPRFSWVSPDDASSKMTNHLVQDILAHGGKDLDSDLQISAPPLDFSGLNRAVDGICDLMRLKAANLGLGW